MSEKFTPKITEQTTNWALNKNTNKPQFDFESAQKLTEINNVLQILKLPNSQEKIFRKILENQKSQTLQSLVTKPKDKILTFLHNEITKDSIQIKTEEVNKQANIRTKIDKHNETQSQKDLETSKENIKINKKIQKIKSILPPNSDISKQLNSIDSKTTEEKEAIFSQILNTLKSPWKLKSITDELGWANKNNPKYLEFKNTLLWLDSSFEDYFNDLENTNLGTDEVVNSIEKDSKWTINIDLKADQPISKMSLIWSDYSFDKEIDKKALSDIMIDSQNQIDATQNGFTVLKGFIKPFDSLLNQIREHWWKEDFKEALKNALANFNGEIFDELDEVYKDMNIKSDEQITKSDISSFADIISPDDLRLKVENIKEKLLNLKSKISETQAWVLKQYQTELKEILKRKSEEKERELEVLKFLNASGFDLFPKEITNKLIAHIQNGSIIIPWLDLDITNIDLKNWNFWDNSWLNDISKANIVKFVNKIISWDVNEPLSVDEIVSWTLRADKEDLMSKAIKAGIVDNLGWKYGEIVENLREKELGRL